MSDLMLDVGQANELKLALRRAGATGDEVKRMGEGDFMKGVIGLLRGEYTLAPVAKAVTGAPILLEHLTGTVNVDGKLGPERALKAVGGSVYINKDVLNFMPRGRVGVTELVFAKFGKYMPAALLESELIKHGLALADPFAAMAWNATNHQFANTHPNGTQWVDSDGNYYCATFCRNDRPIVRVDRRNSDWESNWWFVCVRISTSD